MTNARRIRALVVDDEPLGSTDGVAPHLGGTSRLEQIIRAHQVERVIIAFSLLSGDELVELSRRCMDLGVQVDIVPRMYEVIGSRNCVHFLDGLPLLGLRAPRLSRAAEVLKRGLANGAKSGCSKSIWPSIA